MHNNWLEDLIKGGKIALFSITLIYVAVACAGKSNPTQPRLTNLQDLIRMTSGLEEGLSEPEVRHIAKNHGVDLYHLCGGPGGYGLTAVLHDQSAITLDFLRSFNVLENESRPFLLKYWAVRDQHGRRLRELHL